MIRTFCIAVCVFAGMGVLATRARAAVAPSRVRVQTAREKNLNRVRRLLDRQAVRERLDEAGMDRQEIEARLEVMEDEDLELLAERLDSLAVGRSALGVVVVVLVIATLVLLIVWLAQRV
jgi:hypothetical protein